MGRRGLAVAWIALGVLFLVLLVWELAQWGSLVRRGNQVAAEQIRLTGEMRAKEQEMVREMRAHSDLLREMQWSPDRADPTVFLTGLAEQARGARLKITAIGPLERQAAPQFRKSWHQVQVVAPYQELKNLATRIEFERGVLEDVLVEPPKQDAKMEVAKKEEVQARFKLTTVELTPEAKAIIQRALRASPEAPGAPAKPEAPLALLLPSRPEEPAQALRDPFAFVATAPPARPARVAALPSTPSPRPPGGQPGTPPPASVKPEPVTPPRPMEVKGIVMFPGGALAIVNDRIVKVGDQVDGHRVERITETEVVLRQPDRTLRTVTLSSITAVPRAAPRR